MKTPRRLLTVFTSLLILALVASASIAGTRVGSHPEATSADESLTIVGHGSGAAGFDEGSTGDETDDEGSDDAPEVDPDREAACNEAAGIEPAPEEEATDEPPGTDGAEEPEELHGLDNAIAHVLANCLKNPQAPGLVNALEHLTANKAKHEAHETWKAEKAAARAEAKAAKHAEGSGHGAGHGSSGEHGNPHEDQSYGNHGEGNGQAGSHGNGH